MEKINLPIDLPKTKIVATIGPSSWDDNVLSQMINSGMTVARINASFADHRELTRVLKKIRYMSRRVALMIDTQGHKIRVGDLDIPLELSKNQILKMSSRIGGGDFYIDYDEIHKILIPGNRVLIDDGRVELLVKGIAGDVVELEVISGKKIESHKTVNLPDSVLPFPSLTTKDKDDIEFAVDNGFEFIAASFIRSSRDVEAIKEIVKESSIKIIAKIENSEGLENFDAILSEVDGIMVARGDLGIELPMEKVPVIQKDIIKKCRDLGKMVIVATEMMDSMVNRPRPTRAEVSDVANAVIDGTDAVMLSAETCTGSYPVESVKWMSKVIREAENSANFDVCWGKTSASIETDALARNVVDLTNELPIDRVVVGSKTGTTALSVSRHKPSCQIIAFVNNETLMRQLNLARGIYPVYARENFPADRDWLVRTMLDLGLKEKYLEKEHMVVLVTGSGVSSKSRNTIVEITKVFDLI